MPARTSAETAKAWASSPIPRPVIEGTADADGRSWASDGSLYALGRSPSRVPAPRENSKTMVRSLRLQSRGLPGHLPAVDGGCDKGL
jgi:hypothetical protein